MSDEAPAPGLKALRIVLALLAVTFLVTLVLTGLSSCHHRGWV